MKGGGLDELDRSTFARFEEEATVFLAKFGTAGGALGILTVATLVSSAGVWGFTLERHIFVSSVFDLTLLLMGLELGFCCASDRVAMRQPTFHCTAFTKGWLGFWLFHAAGCPV